MKQPFPTPLSIFRQSRLPEQALPVGYAALIHAYELNVPLPHTLCAIGPRHKIYAADGWRLYTPRHEPAPSLEGHLVFALKYEGLDLIILKRLFQAVSPCDIEAMVHGSPSSKNVRRVWFLYEWLLSTELNLPDATAGPYPDIVDPKLQWATKGTTSSRHRVRNNLPGTPLFCPMVWRTEVLDAFVAAGLAEKAAEIVGKIPGDILARTAAFLLLKDSKSSYVIEGESPAHDRVRRWGQAIGEAGKHPLDLDELLRLQRIVIGDSRFIHMGLRDKGGFVGEHDRAMRQPLPDHISAKPQDLPSLIQGLVDYAGDFSNEIDPVIAAATLSFGFVYIHPFADGNGRLHRYLIHHVLTSRGFNPPGIVFPISFAILERVDAYRHVLESYSQRVLPCIEWEPTEDMNVTVLNDTADFYRYFDATKHAEFLFECVQKTIEVDLPEEAAYLRKYDEFKGRVEEIVDMPASTVDLLFSFLKQNNGRLSKRAREKEFAPFVDEEVVRVEAIYQSIFDEDLITKWS